MGVVIQNEIPRDRKNLLKAELFETPDFIPMQFHINESCWTAYPQDSCLNRSLY